MKLSLHYVNDASGNIQAVQLPFSDWKKLVNKLRKYEQALKLQSELKEALEQVEAMRKSKAPKQTLSDFLNEL